VKRIVTIATVSTVVVSAVVIGFFRFLWFGSVTVENIDILVTLQIDDTLYAARATNGTFRLRPGTHSFRGYSTLGQSEEAQVTVAPFSDNVLKLDIYPVDKKQLSESILGDIDLNHFRITRSELFENDTWLVIFVESIDFTREGYSAVYKFDGVSWVVVESGTGFNESLYVSKRFPVSVINFLEGSE
jgi:hypothetical protein